MLGGAWRGGKMEEVRRRDQQAGCGAGRGGLGLSEVGGLGALGLYEALGFHSSPSLFFDTA
jgi:hypothetical protein